MAAACEGIVQRNPWSSIFLETPKTLKDSTLFVKKLLAVGFSYIVYHRKLFPEDAYEDYDLDGLKVMILVDDSSSCNATDLVTWMKSAFQAIDLKYLRQVTLGIHSDPGKNRIDMESYTFKISYNQDEAFISELTTKQNDVEKTYDARGSAVNMLRKLYLINQSLKPLPSKVYLTMRLKYYDAVTPADYEPVGYRPIVASDYKSESQCVTLKVADITTMHHNVKLQVTLNRDVFEDNTDGNEREVEVVDVQEKPQLVCIESESKRAKLTESSSPSTDQSSNSSQSCIVAQDLHLSETDTSYQSGHNIDGQAEKDTNSAETQTESHNKTKREEMLIHGEGTLICCECGVSEDDGVMILCDNCLTWQHALCYKLLKKHMKDEHLCLECAVANGKTCTDSSLQDMSKEVLQKTCLLRRILDSLKNYREIVSTKKISKFLGVTLPQAEEVKEWLTSLSAFKKGI